MVAGVHPDGAGQTPSVPERSPQRPGEVLLDDTAAQALEAVLRLRPAVATAVRERTPARPRPRPQNGPSADYS